MLTGVIFAALMVTNVEIDTESACPGEAMVRAEFLRLGLDSSPGVVGDRVILTEGRNGEVGLELKGPDGTDLGSRTFSPPFQCDELARAVALAVAIWESDIHPEYTPILVAQEPTVPEISVADTPAAIRPQEIVAKPPSSPPSVDGRSHLVRKSAASRSRDPVIADSEVGVGASIFQAPTATEFASDGIALGMGVIAIKRPRSWPLGLWLSGNVEENRTTSLSLGSGQWRRTRGTAGVTRSRRMGTSSLVLEGRGGISAAWLSAKGMGFAMNYAASTYDLGLEGGLRVSMRHSALLPWIDFSVVRWLSSHELLESNPQGGRPLPVWLLGLTLGVSLGWSSDG